MAGKLEWLPSMDLGLAQLDADHRVLFTLIGRLTDHVEAGDSERALALASHYRAIMDTHFAEEERLMDRHAYPGLAGHLAAHQRARQLVDRILATVAERGPVAAAPLVDDLSRQYFRNLLQEDGVLVEWLKERGDLA